MIQLVNESTYKAGDVGSGRSPGEGNGNPLQCSFLRYAMDRGSWTVGVLQSVGSQETNHTFRFLS